MKANLEELVKKFEAGRINNTTFKHYEHVAVAYGLLSKYLFEEATYIYARIIRKMAEEAGAKDKFNVTITFAFMGVIAERMETKSFDHFEAFIESNSDLLEKNILQNWYSTKKLNSQLARNVLVLPMV